MKYREKKVIKWIVLIYYNVVYCYRLVNLRFITLNKVSVVFVYLFSAQVNEDDDDKAVNVMNTINSKYFTLSASKAVINY